MAPDLKSKKMIALKIPINAIIEGEYIIEKEQEPNYLLLNSELKIYRVNLAAVVVMKEKIGMITTFLLDDGTGKITARLFEENKALKNSEVGDAVCLIGRIRVYNNEKYISPEILKKVDPLWLRVRKEEMREQWQNGKSDLPKEKNTSKEELERKTSTQKRDLLFKEEKTSGTIALPIEKITKIIKELDQGQGVFIEEIMERSPLKDTDALIKRMLENGDIFQNQPGKVKVL